MCTIVHTYIATYVHVCTCIVCAVCEAVLLLPFPCKGIGWLWGTYLVHVLLLNSYMYMYVCSNADRGDREMEWHSCSASRLKAKGGHVTLHHTVTLHVYMYIAHVTLLWCPVVPCFVSSLLCSPKLLQHSFYSTGHWRSITCLLYLLFTVHIPCHCS